MSRFRTAEIRSPKITGNKKKIQESTLVLQVGLDIEHACGDADIVKERTEVLKLIIPTILGYTPSEAFTYIDEDFIILFKISEETKESIKSKFKHCELNGVIDLMIDTPLDFVVLEIPNICIGQKTSLDNLKDTVMEGEFFEDME